MRDITQFDNNRASSVSLRSSTDQYILSTLRSRNAYPSDHNNSSNEIKLPNYISKHGGKISNDYGQIPSLRVDEPKSNKKKNNFVRNARSIMDNY